MLVQYTQSGIRLYMIANSRGVRPSSGRKRSADVSDGSKTEVSGLARHVRFTLRCRHRQPAPACPFGARLGLHAPRVIPPLGTKCATFDALATTIAQSAGKRRRARRPRTLNFPSIAMPNLTRN